MNDDVKTPIRVLLADDHPIVMSGFSLSLTTMGIEVIGEVTTPNEAVQMYETLQPEVLIMDLRFGERLTGLDAAKTILKNHPAANIVFLSQFDQDALIKQTYSIGGRAFVTKDCSAADLAQAVTDALLDPRELEIFILTAKGRTNQEMADQLGLSQKTISNISHSLKVKLGTNRIADLTLLAVKHGYVEP
jgi:two-component system invasion response regulator UvrY